MHVSAVPTDCGSRERVVPAKSLSTTAFGRVVACVDTSEVSRKVIPHAVVLANAVRAPLTVLHVLEIEPTAGIPADPVEWDIRRHSAHDHAMRVVRSHGGDVAEIDVRIIEGQPAEQICLWARSHKAGATVIGTRSNEGAPAWQLGDTARRLLDQASGMLLLVPATVADVPIVHYRRLLVPLDGSCQAESALPLAMRIAEAEDAELLLVHVVPVPELTEVGPLEAADIRLRQDVISRNEQVARQYLDRIRALVEERGIGARNLLLCDGDVRNQLTRLVVEESVDLVVLSAHGRTARADVSCGSIASYLVTHAQAPLLLKLNGTLASARRMIPGSGRNGRFLSRAAL